MKRICLSLLLAESQKRLRQREWIETTPRELRPSSDRAMRSKLPETAFRIDGEKWS